MIFLSWRKKFTTCSRQLFVTRERGSYAVSVLESEEEIATVFDEETFNVYEHMITHIFVEYT